MTAVYLPQLAEELDAAGVPHNGLGTPDGTVETTHTYDPEGFPTQLPPEAAPVLAAHVAPPPLTDHAGLIQVWKFLRTTDDQPHEVFRFPCKTARLYEAAMSIRGIDAGNGAVKRMVGEFVWKRLEGNAIVTGLTVVSDIHDTAAAAWAPNCAAVGTDVVFTVRGAAGRTIDWFLSGSVGEYAPGGTGAA